MTNTAKIIPALALVAVVGVTSVLLTPDASAFEGEHGRRGQGMRQHQGEHFGLVPKEIHDQMREEFTSMTEEERAAFREQRRESHAAHHAALEEFTGLSREELREARHSGEKMGDLLEEKGITEEEAQAFLTEQANAQVDNIVANHDLTSEQEQSIRDRIAEFVQHILDRWFG